MTVDERDRMIKYSFDDLWGDLWINKYHRIVRDSYAKARERYEIVKDRIPFYLNSTRSDVIEPPWGFPKGKRNGRETEIQTAIREFSEETKMNPKYLNIFNTKPFVETFMGTNNKIYSTHYYIAETESMLDVRKIKLTDCIRLETVSEEVMDIKWLTFEEVCEKISAPYRRDVLKQVHQLITQK